MQHMIWRIQVGRHYAEMASGRRVRERPAVGHVGPHSLEVVLRHRLHGQVMQLLRMLARQLPKEVALGHSHSVVVQLTAAAIEVWHGRHHGPHSVLVASTAATWACHEQTPMG